MIRTMLLIVFLLKVLLTSGQNEILSYQNASQKCTEIGMELPLTPQSLNDDERNSVSNKNGSWVRLKKHTKETEKKGYSENEDEDSSPTIGPNNCLYVDSNGDFLTSDCLTAKLGFICENPDCRKCDHVKSCISAGGMCYNRHCGKHNWYNARTECKKRANKLATNITSVIGQVKKFWSTQDRCNEFWLGVHKEDWYIQSFNEDEKPLMADMWGLNVEDSDQTNCAVMYKDEGEFWWKPVKCTDSYHGLCVNVTNDGRSLDDSKTISVKTKVEKSTTNSSESNWHYYVADTLILLMIGFIPSICVTSLLLFLLDRIRPNQK